MSIAEDIERLLGHDKPLDWRELAFCAGVDPELWFPDGVTEHGAIAKRICAACPVQEECLEWAIDNNEYYGIWGGVGMNERIRIRKQRQQEREAAA